MAQHWWSSPVDSNPLLRRTRRALILLGALALGLIPAFTVAVRQTIAGSAPTVTSVGPEVGTTGGGVRVTVNGSGFPTGSPTVIPTVKFGSTAGTSVVVNSSTQLVVSSPAESAGEVDIVVTVNGQSSVTSTADKFLYAAPGAYHAITPFRICDTRAGNGTQCSGHTLAGGGTFNLTVLGVGGIPSSNVAAVIANLTAVGPPSSGSLSVYPTGLAEPTSGSGGIGEVAYSSVNIANLSELPLGTGGQVTLQNNGSTPTDAVIDVQGYLVTNPGSGVGLMNALNPAQRVCDTRANSGLPCAGDTLAGGGSLNVQVTGYPASGGVPTSGVAAVVVDITAVNEASAGTLTAYQQGTSEPATSNLNWVSKVVVSNRAIVAVSSSGMITLTNNLPGSTDVIVDVDAWFTDSSNQSATGSLYDPSVINRICDTQHSGNPCYGKTLQTGTVLPVQVTGQGGVPAMTVPETAVALNITVTNATASTFLVVYPDGGQRPDTDDINVPHGGFANFAAVVPLGADGKVDIYNLVGSVDVTVDVEGYYWNTSLQQPVLLGEQPFYTFTSHRLWDRATLKVNVASGDLILQETDLQLQGTGINFVVNRFYNSLASGNGTGSFGAGWVMGTGYNVSLSFGSGTATLNGPSGYTATFSNLSGGKYSIEPTGLDASLYTSGATEYTGKSCAAAYCLTWHKDDEQYLFNSSGVLTNDKDQNGNSIDFSYNGSNGHLASVVDSKGTEVTLGYSGGYISSISDSSGRSMTYNQSGGNLTSFVDAMNNTTQYGYSGDDLTDIKNPSYSTSGDETKLTYDGSGRVTKISYVTNPSTGATVSEKFNYATPGTTVVTDENGNTTTYTYDLQGRVTQVIDADGDLQQGSYTNNSDLNSFLDSGGGTTSMSWSTDGNNNLDSVQQPNPAGSTTGAVTSFTYGDAGLPFYPTTYAEPQGSSFTYQYDSNGNLLNGTDSLQAENEVKLINNSNGTVAGVLDADGHDDCTANGSAATECFSYDPTVVNGKALDNLLTATYPSPLGSRSFTYDSLNRMHTMTDGKSQLTTYKYDALDRLVEVDYAGGSKVTQTFDADGNLTATGDTSFTYDHLNRQLTKQQGTPAATLTYGYDGAGNLTSFNDGSGAVTYTYDAANRLIKLTESNGNVTTFTNDSRGNRTQTVLPNGVTITESYDGSSRVTNITATKGSTTLENLSYCYAKGAGGGCSGGTDTNLRYQVTNNAASPVDTTTYVYDAVDRLTQASDSQGSFNDQYSYDGDSNLLSAPGLSFAYNDANEVCWEYPGSSSAACASPPAGASTFGYDANGNETADAVESLAYNSQDQTTSIDTVALTYNGLGQDDLRSDGNTSFASGTLGLSLLTNSNGTSHFIRDNQGGLVGVVEGGGSEYYYLSDGLGSVVGLTGGNGGEPLSYTYSPFGVSTPSATQGVPQNQLQFTGALQDNASNPDGIDHMGARFYDPSVGRWTQQDPIFDPASPQGWDRYVYAGDDPVNVTDPSGNCGLSSWGDFGSCFTSADSLTGILTGGFGCALVAMGGVLLVGGLAAVSGGVGVFFAGAAIPYVVGAAGCAAGFALGYWGGTTLADTGYA